MPNAVSHPAEPVSRTRVDHRLCKHADYQRVYKIGRKQFSRQIAYFAAWQSPEGITAGPRIGLTVPKALGKAVDRNRIKRRLRALVRASLPLLTAPVDVVLHPRRSVLEAEFDVLAREVSGIFRAVQATANRGQEAFAKPPADATSQRRGGGAARPAGAKRSPGSGQPRKAAGTQA